MYKSDGTFISYTNNTVTIPDGYAYYGVFLLVASGTTVDKTYYPRINAGDTSLPYEPYTGGSASPNPDYPQDLVSVVNPTIGITGANLFDASRLPSTSRGGVEITNNGDGSFGISGLGTTTEVCSCEYSISHDDMCLLFHPGKLRLITNVKTYPMVFVNLYKNGSFHSTIMSSTWSRDYAFELPEEYFENDIYSLRVGLHANANTTIINGVVKPILTQYDGTIDEVYKGHQTAIINRTLSGIPVDSNGNYTDSNGQQWICDEIDFERGVYIQRVRVKTFVGDEDWLVGEQNVDEGYHGVFYTSNNDALPSCRACCSHYLQGNSVGVIGMEGCFDTYYSQFRINIGEFTTVDEWKTQLATWAAADTPLTLAYILERPVETTLTEEELAVFSTLCTHKTNTSVSNDAGAWMTVEYSRDVRMYIRDIVYGDAGLAMKADNLYFDPDTSMLYLMSNGDVIGDGVVVSTTGGNVDLSGYATEEFVKNKIAQAELGGEEVDLSGYAQKSELPTKVSQLQNDSGYLTAVPDGYAKTEDIPKNAADIGAQPEGDYALRSEIPSVPVKSVNGKTGAVSLTAVDVKARPDSWMPTAADVGALPSSTVIPTVPTKVSAFTNDAGYLTEHQDISGKANVTDVAIYITPEQYGAKGDGSTDDSIAIQAAISNAGSSKVVYLAKKTYKISSGLLLNVSHSSFKCDGEILYDGTDAAVTLNAISNANIYIDRITASSGTALKLDGTSNHVLSNNITVNYILSSVVGINLYTNGRSICYNDIHSNIIKSTETGLKVWVEKSYVNDNRYHLGYIGGGCAKGIWLYSNPTLELKNDYGTNANRFLSGSIEGVATDGCAIYMENSSGNEFHNFRLQENYGKNIIVFKGLCGGNDIRLSQVYLYRVDASGLTSGSEYNYLRTANIMATQDYSCGQVACVSYSHGIIYDPNYVDITGLLSTTNFPDKVIGMMNGTIPTTLVVNNSAGDNVEYTLGSLYSERTSLARGFPLVIRFDSTSGHIIIRDSRGGTVLDNSDLRYRGKTVAIRWAGRNKEDSVHVWDVKEVGAKYITESELNSKGYLTSVPTEYITESELNAKGYLTAVPSEYVTETELSAKKYLTAIPSEYVTDSELTAKGYLTQHQDISGKADKSSAETWTFTLTDGSTVTKKVVLA